MVIDQIEKAKKSCEKYGFQYHESVNGLFIRTVSLAGWYILITDDKPKLLHENYRHIYRYGKGALESYHEHPDVEEDTADGMVEYIRAHDLAMMRVRNNKKKKYLDDRKKEQMRKAN